MLRKRVKGANLSLPADEGRGNGGPAVSIKLALILDTTSPKKRDRARRSARMRDEENGKTAPNAAQALAVGDCFIIIIITYYIQRKL